jgi:hypothetical protein
MRYNKNSKCKLWIKCKIQIYSFNIFYPNLIQFIFIRILFKLFKHSSVLFLFFHHQTFILFILLKNYSFLHFLPVIQKLNERFHLCLQFQWATTIYFSITHWCPLVFCFTSCPSVFTRPFKFNRSIFESVCRTLRSSNFLYRFYQILVFFLTVHKKAP